MNYYTFFPADYARDTTELSDAEDLAYRRLLDYYYVQRKALPCDLERLCRIARVGRSIKRKDVQFVVETYFVRTDQGYANYRADKEIAKYDEKTEKARESAKIRWENERKRNANADASADANAMLENMQTPCEPPCASDALHHHPQHQTLTPSPSSRARKAQQNGNLDFDRFWGIYPKRNGSQPKAKAAQAANARIKQGCSFDDMLAGAQRYKAWCDATDKTGTEHVMQARTFLGPELHFLEPWDLPKSKMDAATDNILREIEDGEF